MIGIDLVKIERIERFMDKFGDRALERFLNKDEIKFANSTQTIAGFWAAKEAVAKALKTGIGKECSFFDIVLGKLPSGAPHFLLSEHLMRKFSISDTSLSISHDGDYAIAVASIEKKVFS